MILYIDPGTGSMLFSLFIGLAAAIYYFVKMAFIRVKFMLTGKSSERSSSRDEIAVYCEAGHYWNVFKPVLDELENSGRKVSYYTSAKDDPFFDGGYKSVKGRYIGEGNRAFAFLNFLQADVCLMTTPGLDVYQLKRSKDVSHYSHILHAVDDATSYEMFGLDYFDSVLLSGEYQKEGVREVESKRGDTPKELEVVGCPYLDVLRLKVEQDSSGRREGFTVLVAPSWGRNSILVKYGSKMLDVLAKSDLRVIVRPHPQSMKSEPGVIESLRERYGDRLEWDFAPENLGSLSRADVMISDFSSVIFDYAFLFERPVFYVMQDFNMEIYDAGELDEKPWKFKAIERIGVEVREEDFPDLPERLVKSAGDESLLREIRKAKGEAWQHVGESGVRTAAFLLRKVDEVQAGRAEKDAS